MTRDIKNLSTELVKCIVEDKLSFINSNIQYLSRQEGFTLEVLKKCQGLLAAVDTSKLKVVDVYNVLVLYEVVFLSLTHNFTVNKVFINNLLSSIVQTPLIWSAGEALLNLVSATTQRIPNITMIEFVKEIIDQQ